ncbi:AAWKG family protein [Streptomyces tendae]|uniref:AAWKG family protein n=1 Tax=Streptomyces tendae TaxID=1932 RepID=UPI003D7615C0
MAASYGQNDVWGQAVNLLTGYPMPDRATMFDKVRSDPEEIPLFHMQIETINATQVTEHDFTVFDGWEKTKTDDYILPFYSKAPGNSTLYLKKARIVFIGIPVDGNGRANLFDDKELSEGGPFKGPKSDTEWDTGPMSQYISGAKYALQKLVEGHTTYGVSYSGATVLNQDAVDLKKFEEVARSFDRSMQFFLNHSQILGGWEKQMGDEKAAWKGHAAGVFYNLVHGLNKNYESYVRQLGGSKYTSAYTMLDGHSPKSKPAEYLAHAQGALWGEGLMLLMAWDKWASGKNGAHWPHRWLLNLLDELSVWVIANNVKQVLTTDSVSANFTYNHPQYGDLTNLQTWKRIGEEAVDRWNKHVDAVLTVAGGNVLENLKKSWALAVDGLGQPLETKGSTSLVDEGDLGGGPGGDDNKLNDEFIKNLKNLGGKNNGGPDLGPSLDEFGDKIGDGFGKLNDGLNLFGDHVGDGFKNLNGGIGNLAGGITDSLSDFGGGLNNLGLSSIGLSGPGATSPLNNLGGLGGGGPLNNLGVPGGGGVNNLTNPDGSKTRLNPDGSLITTYPDGSKSIFNPATGRMTTVSADGRTTTSDLPKGGTVRNPDGTTTTLNADGTLTTTYPDGTTTTVDPSTGKVNTVHPDGSSEQSLLNAELGSFTTPGGGSAHLNPDGTVTTTYPDGSSETVDPAAHTVTTTLPDGSTQTSHLDTGGSVTNPDGSTTTLNPDGSLTTEFPDGTTQVLKPDGTLVTTGPDGSTTTSSLNEGLGIGDPGSGGVGDSLDHLSDSLDGLNDLDLDFGLPDDFDLNLPEGPSGTGGAVDAPDLAVGGPGPLNSDLASGYSDELFTEDPDDTGFFGGAVGAPPPTGAGQAGGGAASGPQSLNQGLGAGGVPPMGGMGGMGGAGNNESKGERVRTVHGDSDGASLPERQRRGRSVDVDEDEDDLVLPRRSTATTGSASVQGGGSGSDRDRRGGQSRERKASYVVEEEEDVWGTEDGGAPAVIG